MTKAKKPAKARKPARKLPIPLTDADLDHLCAFVACGGSLSEWARRQKRKKPTVIDWIMGDPERVRRYREARKLQIDAMIDDLIELCDAPVPVDSFGRTDSAAVQQLRLRVDTRKWIAAKLLPGQYGDRLDVSGAIDVSSKKPAEIMGMIVQLLASNGLRITAEHEDDGSREAG